MKVLNIGSLNLDYVYNVSHIVQPGETLLTGRMHIYPGGKGLNQSVALARAGIPVYHGGMIGKDGGLFLEVCKTYGIHADYIKMTEEKSGHTIIQVDENGQNCILLYGGANQCLTKTYVDKVLKDFGIGDWLLLQNEVNELAYIIDRAYEKGMKIAFNPSPYNTSVSACDLHKITLFLLNEIEGEQMAGTADPKEIVSVLKARFPNAGIVLTLGENGVLYEQEGTLYEQGIFKVETVDTTAAGDTFTGYFLAGLTEQMAPQDILKMSAKASAIAVTRKGAVTSIPARSEVDKMQ